MMASVTLLTGAWLWRRGGARLFKRLAFPLAFAWSAVPWPTNVEEVVTLKLRGLVTSASVSTLHLMGVQASHQGNIINLASGSVVVDSACSGISSLQSTLMVSLFLGEFFRFRAARRILLLAGGACLAIGANLARATTLVWLASSGGPDKLLKYHDRVGCAETGVIFLALATAAWYLSRKQKSSFQEEESPVDAGEGGWAGNGGFVALAAFAAIPLLAWAWFALSPGGPIRMQDKPLWALKTGAEKTAWRVQPVELSPIDARTLGCTDAQTLSLEGPASAEVYHFFWKTDSSTGFGHTPDNCMTCAGWRKECEPVSARLRIKNAEIPCKVYRFARDGERTVVFQSVWYGGDPMLRGDAEFPDTKDAPRGARLSLLWNEPRRRGLESLNVYMPPARDAASEIRMAEEVLGQVLVSNR